MADRNAPSSSAAEQPAAAADFGAQMRATAQARRRDLGDAPKEARPPLRPTVIVEGQTKKEVKRLMQTKEISGYCRTAPASGIDVCTPLLGGRGGLAGQL